MYVALSTYPFHFRPSLVSDLQAMLGSADPQPMPAMVASALPEEVPRLLDRAISDGVAHNILLTMGPRLGGARTRARRNIRGKGIPINRRGWLRPVDVTRVVGCGGLADSGHH